jgi:hypothetical protein
VLTCAKQHLVTFGRLPGLICARSTGEPATRRQAEFVRETGEADARIRTAHAVFGIRVTGIIRGLVAAWVVALGSRKACS